jgi:hypothetical protein
MAVIHFYLGFSVNHPLVYIPIPGNPHFWCGSGRFPLNFRSLWHGIGKSYGKNRETSYRICLLGWNKKLGYTILRVTWLFSGAPMDPAIW